MEGVHDWLLNSAEPWTRYRALIDLYHLPGDSPEVVEARADMIRHPQVRALMTKAASWPCDQPLKRHNDAKHPMYALTTLADFGIHYRDLDMLDTIGAVTAHQSPEGPFEVEMQLYKRFTGIDGVYWTWMACDSPLIYALAAMGMRDSYNVQRAVDFLLRSMRENGWGCCAAPIFGEKFRGPGKVGDPCPIVNVDALKILSLFPDLYLGEEAQAGTEMLLHHYELRGQKKHYLFGIGSDFHKLKYPFIWYDLLHVTDVLSRFPFAHHDPRFLDMLHALTDQADDDGRYTATSMYRAWKGWSFADKKQPSRWLTFLVQRIQHRVGEAVLV